MHYFLVVELFEALNHLKEISPHLRLLDFIMCPLILFYFLHQVSAVTKLHYDDETLVIKEGLLVRDYVGVLNRRQHPDLIQSIGFLRHG